MYYGQSCSSARVYFLCNSKIQQTTNVDAIKVFFIYCHVVYLKLLFYKPYHNHIIKSRMKLAEEMGMSPDFMKDVLVAIHDESVRQQVEVFNDRTR